MAKLLRLAFTLGSSCLSLPINGDWKSILLAADNVEKIEQGGDLRVQLRHLECVDACDKLAITFFVKLNGECHKFSAVGIKGANGVYETDFSGDNYFQIKYVKNGFILFYNKNVDADGKVTYVTLIAGKYESLSEEQKTKFEELTVEKNIPKENIRNIIETGKVTFPLPVVI
uniref:Lipocalin/cytosolic fatty-acid binding domain-containing protein n=1 Tax=Urocitellus parryii TaxID=9999 RepID=A0A8D2HJA8_UROPR